MQKKYAFQLQSFERYNLQWPDVGWKSHGGFLNFNIVSYIFIHEVESDGCSMICLLCLHCSILDIKGEQGQWKWHRCPDDFTAIWWNCQYWNMVSLFFCFFNFPFPKIKVHPFILLCFLLFVSYQVKHIQRRCEPHTILPATLGDTQVNSSVKLWRFIQQQCTCNINTFPLLPGTTSLSRQRRITLSARTAVSCPRPLTSWPWLPPALPCRWPGTLHGILG